MRRIVTALALVVMCLAVGSPAFAAEPVKVSLYIPGNPQDLADLASVMKAAKDYSVPKVGAYIDLQPISWGDWFDKKRLMIQSGEECDIMFTADWNDFEDEVARNAWLPLNDLIAKNTPDLQKIVGNWLKGPSVGGKIYGIPTVKEAGQSFQFLFNKKYIDKYKIDPTKIKSYQDLEPWLAKIKAGEPGIVPYLLDAGSELPLSQRFAWEEVAFKFYRDASGKVRYIYDMDEIWKLSKVMWGWFNKGYFQPESADGTDDQASSKYYKAGTWFAACHVSHPGKTGELSNQYGYPIVGSGPVVPPMVLKGTYIGSIFAISRTSKHPVEALKLIELMNKDKVFNNILNWGIEGKHYKMVNKDKGILNPLANTGYNLASSWMMQNQLISYITTNENPDKWALYKKYNESAGEYPTVGFFPNLKPVKSQVSAVENAMKKYDNIIIRGLQDPDTLKAEVQKALKDAGVADIEAELQKQVDAYIATKK